MESEAHLRVVVDLDNSDMLRKAIEAECLPVTSEVVDASASQICNASHQNLTHESKSGKVQPVEATLNAHHNAHTIHKLFAGCSPGVPDLWNAIRQDLCLSLCVALTTEMTRYFTAPVP